MIPFILLLVVAIVLKKREDANKDGASAKVNKTNNKKATKKNVARTARTTSQRQQTSVVEDTVVLKQITKPLSADLKKSIEQLIAEKNFFSAEAKINQALNQDNAQHELYLYLLDVHLAQKDEFAVNQLINHIRSLGLDEIVAQAEEKQKAAHVDKPIESIAFVSSTPTVDVKKDTTAFDELIGGTTPVASIADVLPQSSNEALEFTSSTPAIKSTDETAQPLEFSLDPKPQASVQPLEFSLASDTALSTEKELTPEAQPIDAVIEEVKTDTIAPLEFSFTPEATPVEKAPEVENISEFKLDFTEATPTASLVEEVEFKLAPETEVQPTLNFDLEQKVEFVEPTPSVQELANHVQEKPATQAESNFNDPLVQAFPELAEVNEIQLNLDLAQQYISLGAFTSALELLAQDGTTYTPQQREQSQILLNQIAS